MTSAVSPTEDDPYFSHTPAYSVLPDKVCSCEGEPPLLLYSSWGEILCPHPLHCGVCRGDVAAERALPPDAELVNYVGYYAQLGSCMDYLWIDSGVYEEFARRELENPDSDVNQRGLEAAREVSRHRPCYYRWFQYIPMDETQIPPMTDCTVCGTPLTTPEEYDLGVNVCEVCHVAAWNH